MLRVVFADLKIGRAAECYGACMAKGFPKPVRTRYRGSGSRTFDGFTRDDAIVGVIKRHDYEMGDFGHACPPLGEISNGIFHRSFFVHPYCK
jgi:hypothetical protein